MVVASGVAIKVFEVPTYVRLKGYWAFPRNFHLYAERLRIV